MEEVLSPEQWNHLQIQLKLKFPQLSDEDTQYHESLEYDLLRMVGFALNRNILKIPGIFCIHEHIPVQHNRLLNDGNCQSGQKVRLREDSISM
jgi:hypothetical protein